VLSGEVTNTNFTVFSLTRSLTIKPSIRLIAYWESHQEEFEDTKGVVIIRKSKDRQHNSKKEKDKQKSTKHYTENY
jgi:hypothetical protein